MFNVFHMFFFAGNDVKEVGLRVQTMEGKLLTMALRNNVGSIYGQVYATVHCLLLLPAKEIQTWFCRQFVLIFVYEYKMWVIRQPELQF
jgi:hypothetical protein